MKDDNIQLFEEQPIRTAWDEEKEEWYFSIVDVVGVLTDSPNPNNYWKVLKSRLIKEGNQSVTSCNQLKLKSHKDGKRYKTDVATTEISKVENPKSFDENIDIAKRGGNAAKKARQAVESETGKSVITSQNASQLNTVVTELLLDSDKFNDK